MYRKMILTASAAALTAAFAGAPAFAGNVAQAPADPVLAPVVPVVASTDWTGGYAGLQLGYGDVDNAGTSGDGVIGGAFVGYNYDFGNYVLGGEFDASASDISVGGIDVDSVYRLKLRAGYDAGPALIYAVAGGANVQTSAGDDSGYVAGLGVDYKVTDRVTVGGEYLYHNFDSFAGTGASADFNTFSARVAYNF